jgi:hypothetical protein
MVHGREMHHNDRDRERNDRNSIMSGVATNNNWVERPDNGYKRNKDDKMVPYLNRHFIYINYAKSMYYVGSGKVTNIPSCVLEFIQDTVHDKKGIYRGLSFQIYGNRSPVREVLLMESERTLHCISTEMTNIVTNLGVYYELSCDCTIQITIMGTSTIIMAKCVVKPLYPT